MPPPADITYPPAATFILVRATATRPRAAAPGTGPPGTARPALGDVAGYNPALHIFAISAG